MEAKRILVVDDDPTVMALTTSVLQKNGYEVISAHDGKHALRILEEVVPDLIVLDVMMPELNGSMLCGILKHSPRFHLIPIIMLTGEKKAIDMVIGQTMKADAFFNKPIDTAVFLAKVKSLLKDS